MTFTDATRLFFFPSLTSKWSSIFLLTVFFFFYWLWVLMIWWIAGWRLATWASTIKCEKSWINFIQYFDYCFSFFFFSFSFFIWSWYWGLYSFLLHFSSVVFRFSKVNFWLFSNIKLDYFNSIFETKRIKHSKTIRKSIFLCLYY